MKKVGSSKADTLVLDCVKQLFPVSIVKIYYLNIRSLGCFKVEIFYLCSEYIYLSVFFALSVVVFFCKRSSLKIFFLLLLLLFFYGTWNFCKKKPGKLIFFFCEKTPGIRISIQSSDPEITSHENKTLSPFYHKNIFYDKMDLRLFYSHVPMWS